MSAVTLQRGWIHTDGERHCWTVFDIPTKDEQQTHEVWTAIVQAYKDNSDYRIEKEVPNFLEVRRIAPAWGEYIAVYCNFR